MKTKDGKTQETMMPECQEALKMLRAWKGGEEIGFAQTGRRQSYTHYDFPGWVFSYDGGRVITEKTTFSAHYMDKGASTAPYYVPTVHIWSTGREEIGGFTRYPANQCGWCGYSLDAPGWTGYECPQCGGC